MTITTTGIKEVSDTERPAPVSLMAMIYRAMDELEHEEQHAIVVAPRLRTVFETTGGGINIPMEFTPRKNGNGALRFTLTKSQIKFIARHIHEPWVKRAIRQDFWQCYACGWTPFPAPVLRDDEPVKGPDGAPVVDDSAYGWFADQHYETRQWFVDISEQMTLSVVQELERGMEDAQSEWRKELNGIMRKCGIDPQKAEEDERCMTLVGAWSRGESTAAELSAGLRDILALNAALATGRKRQRKESEGSRLDKMIEKNRPLGADEKDKIRTKTFNPKSNPKRLKKW